MTLILLFLADTGEISKRDYSIKVPSKSKLEISSIFVFSFFTTFSDIKFRHAGKRQMPLAYEPVMCGTSTLLVTPNEEQINNFECSKTAEIKKQKMSINNSQIANVTLEFGNENIEQIVVEADDTQIVIGKEGALKKEGDFMTSIGFGHSQDQKVKF